MRKIDELANEESCLNRAKSNEMVFVLLGRDSAAPFAIRAWCEERILQGKNMAQDAQILEALAIADAMTRERMR